MKRLMNRGQKGVTLVELMVVMAILVTLAAIVFPAVSGTAETSTNSQVRTDASNVQAAVNEYFADQTGAAEKISSNTSILDNATGATISSRFPEKFLTVGYGTEFPPADTVVTAVTIKLSDGTTVVTPVELANGWNAIDLAALKDANYIQAIPKSDAGKSKSGNFHNYLWLLKKTTATGSVDSRSVEVFQLTEVVKSDTTYALTYEQVY